MDNDLSGNCEDHSSSDSQSRSGNVQGTVGSGPANTSGARESIGEAGSNATPVTAVGSSRSGGKKRKRTSWVYVQNHCSIVNDYKDSSGIVHPGERAVCNYCTDVHFSCRTEHGTGAPVRHLQAYHKDKIPVDKGGTAPSSCVTTNFTYSKTKMRRGLCLYVVAAEQPFTFGDDLRFEYFVKTCLQPAFGKVSRNSTRSDTLKAFAEFKKDFIAEIASLSSSMSFTSDMWTGCNDRGYICVTGHYIDSSWSLRKKIIAFNLAEYPHNAHQIYQSIDGVFRDYGLVDKLFSITFDNASANTSAIELFERSVRTPHHGQFLHMRCVCHIINLVVQDGLKIILRHIQNIREAILFITTSPARIQEFESLCVCYNLKPKKLNTDVRTRWNSTFLMMKSCRNHSEVISAFLASKHAPVYVSNDDWKVASEYYTFLKVFYVATLECSGVSYPTTCLVLGHLFSISNVFAKYRTKPGFEEACYVMEDKFRKYFQNMPPIFYLAAVMDPRIRLGTVVKTLQVISDNLGLTSLPSHDVVLAELTAIYASYHSKFAMNATATAGIATASTATASTATPSGDDSGSFWSFVSEQGGGVTSSSELVKYLEINPLTADDLKNFDILAFWKKNETAFPVLSIMARDLLTPPVSSVASESAFSAGNRVLDERRSRLTPEILDCLICLKDWEDARLGIQRCRPREEFREYFADSDVDGD